MELICELATAHGGDVGLAEAMIAAAAEAGAHTVKVQTYSLEKLNPRDPQSLWLQRSHLDRAAHKRLIEYCQQHGVAFLSTPFDADSLKMLRELGLCRFKIASSESAHDWWLPASGEAWYVSWPWGAGRSGVVRSNGYDLTAIPLYPTPLECVSKAPLLDGWSDHGEGLSACYRALALGAKVLEVHFTIPGARKMPFDKTPEDVRALRRFMDDLTTIETGVAQRYRERWRA